MSANGSWHTISPMVSRKSDDGLTSNYEEFLRFFSQNDNAFQSILDARLGFDATAKHEDDPETLIHGNVVLLDLDESQYKVSYSAKIAKSGVPIGRSSQEMLQELLHVPQPSGNTPRILVHRYCWAEEGGLATEGLNHALAQEFLEGFKVESEFLTLHFEDNKSTVQVLPSQRRMMHLQSSSFVCTAQVCTWSKDSSRSYVVLLIGEYMEPFDQNDELEVRPDNLNLFPTTAASIMLGFYGYLAQSDWRDRRWNLGCGSGQYLHILLRTKFEDADLLHSHPFEVMAPLIRIMLARYFKDLVEYSNSMVDFVNYFQSKKTYSIEELGKIRAGAQAALLSVGFQVREIHALGEDVKAWFPYSLLNKDHPVVVDANYVLARFDTQVQAAQLQQSFLTTLEAMQDNKASQAQNQTVKRLTQLAFVFVPASLVTSAFGMNIHGLQDNGVQWWTVLIGAAVVYVILILLMVMLYLEGHQDKSGSLREFRGKIKEAFRRASKKSGGETYTTDAEDDDSDSASEAPSQSMSHRSTSRPSAEKQRQVRSASRAPAPSRKATVRTSDEKVRSVMPVRTWTTVSGTAPLRRPTHRKATTDGIQTV